MRTTWNHEAAGAVEGASRAIMSPVSLIVSSFAHVQNIRRSLPPQIRMGAQAACLATPKTKY